MPPRPSSRGVFLDRDGVLNHAVIRDGVPHPPASPDDLVIVPGVAAALALLKEQGFCLLAVTNQPDVARGRQTREMVEAMNARLMRELPLDGIYTCYHDDADHCDCRKPKPGLIVQAAREWELEVRGSFLVGDRWKDIEAGRRAGCTTFLIGTGYGEPETAQPDYRVSTLPEVARILSSLP